MMPSMRSSLESAKMRSIKRRSFKMCARNWVSRLEIRSNVVDESQAAIFNPFTNFTS